jgi:hypothetical protein
LYGLEGILIMYVINRYSEIKVVHFLLNFLRIKNLYMFLALLAHPQKALHQSWGSQLT